MQLSWKWMGRTCLAVGVALGLTLSAGQAAAHEGHAGKELVLLDTKLALKQMLPNGAKIVRRKEVVSQAVSDRARADYGVRLEWEGVVSYFLARDEASGQVTGAAMVHEFEYRHGKIKLAVGVGPDGHVTRAAILGIHEKYLPDVVRVGKGFIPSLDGASVADLDAAKTDAENGDRGGHFVYWRLRDMAATLASLMQQVPS